MLLPQVESHLRHIKTEKNETDYSNNFIDFINFL
jgi:hypothetical protein